MRYRLCLFGIVAMVLFSAQGAVESQWRGVRRDGVYPDKELLKKWPEKGPAAVLTLTGLGEGFGSPAVTKDAIYCTGMLGDTGYLFKFDLKGALKYKSAYGKEWKVNYPGVRSTPMIADGKVYLESGLGVVYCLNALDGKTLWSVDILKTFGAENIMWGMTENLLMVDDKVICTPGGKKASVAALDKLTGKTVWTCTEQSGTSAYGSPALITVGKNRIITVMTTEAILAVNPATGELIWLHPFKNRVQPNTPYYKDGYLFCASGYGVGAVMIKLSEDGTSGEEAWVNPQFDVHFEAFAVINGYIYGTGQKAKGWRCLEWKTGKQMYVSEGFMKGNIIVADGMIYGYSDKGVVALIKPDPQKLDIVSTFSVDWGEGTHWAHLVMNNGLLFVRHGSILKAFQVK